jgi:Fe-S-cluster containining protein
MDRAGRKRQAKDDEAKLARGLDPASADPEPVAAMARRMHELLLRARKEADIDPPVRYLYAKAEATLERLKQTRIACRKGCAHCCHIWVSATAPEILYVAKQVRRRGAIEDVRAAHAATGRYSFSIRALHPTPCPMLKDDACSIYETRPVSCRFAVSPDDNACRRVMREFARESVPVPIAHLKGRGGYEIASAIALHRAGLPHYYYELNAALARAVERDDAERAWLSGEDVFADCQRDLRDVLKGAPIPQMTKLAFG